MRRFAIIGVVLSTFIVEPADVLAGPLQLRVTAPRRMINNKTLTVLAEVLDETGHIEWRSCVDYGSVTAVRADDQSPVPISTIVFDTHAGVPPADSMRFYHGVGSVSLVLDNGAAEAAGDMIVSVTYAGLTGSRRVTILSDPPLRNLSGALTGPDLNWSPADGVIHLTGDCTVAAGNTLRLAAGTLVMVDAGPANAGTLLTINGSFEATGNSDEPVFFFPTAGAPALRLMALCSDPLSNYDAWQGFAFDGWGHSLFDHVFLTGAGNGVLHGHTRMPIIHVDGAHSTTFNRCVFADNNGKAARGIGSGTYIVRDSLITRCGHGTEWSNNGFWTLLVEGSWYTGIGHGPMECNRDGDCINVRGAFAEWGGPKIIRGCVLVDGNDDGVDQAATDFTVENCIIGYLRDTAIILDSSLTGGSVICNNVLTFGSGRFGIAGRNQPVYATNCTFADGSRTDPIHDCVESVFDRCIVRKDPLTTCCGAVDYCNLMPGSDLSCGTGNGTYDPMFTAPWPGGCDYSLQPGSPALTAGPGDTPIGWQGFVPPRRGARLFPVASQAAARPGGVLAVDVFAEDATEVAGFSIQIETQLLSGSGSLELACPTCISIDQTRPDRLLLGALEDISFDPPELRATATLANGSDSTGATPRYLATYLLQISPDAAIGSQFQVSVRGFGSSSLSDEAGAPIAFIADSPVTVEAALCPLVEAGPPQQYCVPPANIALAGTVQDAAGAQWTTTGDGSFANPSSPATTYTPGMGDLAAGSVVLTLTASPSSPCTASVADSVTIEWSGIGDGDMNGDGRVDGLDIQPFAEAIGALPVNCDADLTGDNTVDAADITAFVGLLLGA